MDKTDKMENADGETSNRALVRIDERDSLTIEIEQRLAQADRMATALDRMRSVIISKTVPSDWQKFGDNLYLEGDGGLRIAPLIGLELENLQKAYVTKENGATQVTLTADAHSRLFQTRYPGISRARATDDDFLSGAGKKTVDIVDVESACYKGLIGRAVMLLAGISGLTPDEMASRFGMADAGHAVNFRKGAGAVRQEDKALSADDAKEVARLLYELADGDEKTMGDILSANSINKQRDPAKLTAKQMPFVLKDLKALHAKKFAGMEG